MYWFRLWQIAWYILRFRLDTLVPWRSLPWYVRWLSVGRFFLPRPRKQGPERLRLFFEALGPVFIKFGQILSTRRDLYPQEYAEELVRLQDNVPSFPGSQAIAVVEAALEQPVDGLFERFDIEPLASASIAQVHSARLPTGEEVVVKIIRPDIERVIRKDLSWMHAFARLLTAIPEARRLRPVEVVDDFQQTLLDELDLLREAANTSHLQRNFEGSDLLYVPDIHWTYCRRQVLVMERIYGIPIDEIDDLRDAGVDMRALAERGVEIFFTQVFRDSFFHADMHPGNVFVSASKPRQPRYIAIDCGIVGTLGEEDQHYLAMNLLAFFNRDYRRVARLHVESGWVPADTPVHQFEHAIRAVCEPIFARPLKDISFGLLLVRLFQVARRFNMEVQPQLVLLQKTLLNIEGLGRQLYPELDLWRTAKPFMEDWLRERISVRRTVRTLREQIPFLLERSPELPHQLERVVRELGKPQQQTRVRVQAGGRSTPGLVLTGMGILLALYGHAELSDPLLFSGLVLTGLGALATLITASRPNPG